MSATDQPTQPPYDGRVVALATFERSEQVRAAGASLLRGGIACLEIASPTAAALRAARSLDGLTVGAGDVRTTAQAELAARGGAHFATSPVTTLEVVHACRELGLAFVPGVATPSDVQRLASLGVRAMQVFPAAMLGGPSFLRAVGEAFPGVGFIAAGGIRLERLPAYLALPSVLAVVTTDLVHHRHLGGERYKRIEAIARGVRRGLAAECETRPAATTGAATASWSRA